MAALVLSDLGLGAKGNAQAWWVPAGPLPTTKKFAKIFMDRCASQLIYKYISNYIKLHNRKNMYIYIYIYIYKYIYTSAIRNIENPHATPEKKCVP